MINHIIRILQHFATNFGILLILWCSFKLWWNFCPGISRSKFHSYGKMSIAVQDQAILHEELKFLRGIFVGFSKCHCFTDCSYFIKQLQNGFPSRIAWSMHLGCCHIWAESGAFSSAWYKLIQNLQISQGYIFRILQHFATKFCKYTNFKMLFLAAVMQAFPKNSILNWVLKLNLLTKVSVQ
jgi:hypothetical protein